MENKRISHRHTIKVYGIVMVFRKCDIEEILSAAYLPL
jgi:hypothetical protein